MTASLDPHDGERLLAAAVEYRQALLRFGAVLRSLDRRAPRPSLAAIATALAPTTEAVQALVDELAQEFGPLPLS